MKVISAIVTTDQSLWILRTVKMIFGASRLFLVHLPASSQLYDIAPEYFSLFI
jgi:hypothetical protein